MSSRENGDQKPKANNVYWNPVCLSFSFSGPWYFWRVGVRRLRSSQIVRQASLLRLLRYSFQGQYHCSNSSRFLRCFIEKKYKIQLVSFKIFHPPLPRLPRWSTGDLASRVRIVLRHRVSVRKPLERIHLSRIHETTDARASTRDLFNVFRVSDLFC